MYCMESSCCILAESQVGAAVDSREIRYPSEILHTLLIYFSLLGCRWKRDAGLADLLWSWDENVAELCSST